MLLPMNLLGLPYWLLCLREEYQDDSASGWKRSVRFQKNKKERVEKCKMKEGVRRTRLVEKSTFSPYDVFRLGVQN
jgi:hypothetical protein